MPVSSNTLALFSPAREANHVPIQTSGQSRSSLFFFSKLDLISALKIRGILVGSVSSDVSPPSRDPAKLTSSSLKMPPTSTFLYQEGAHCKSFFIVRKGAYQREELKRIMVDEPAQYEGCSGSRCFSDVESDLKAVSRCPRFRSLILLLASSF